MKIHLIASSGNGDPGVSVTTENIILDEVRTSSTGTGTQAVGGATGFGLTSRDVQFFEGAGDGSIFRFSRPLSRDMTIPLYIYQSGASARANLKAAVQKLARILAGQFVVRFYDDDALTSYVWTECVAVGGGDVTYGEGNDTDGETEWRSSVQVRSGSPYWKFSAKVNTTVSGGTGGTATVNNAGSAPTAPVFTLTGPCAGFTATLTATGEAFGWDGTLLTGDTLVVTTALGTVTSTSGTNRYSGLTYAPKFWRLPPGSGQSIGLTIKPRSTSTRKNYETNPNMSGTNTWSTGSVTSPVAGKLSLPVPSTGTRTYTGLTPGASLIFRARMGFFITGTKSITTPANLSITADQSYSINFSNLAESDYSVELVVPSSGTVVVKVKAAVGTGSGSIWTTIDNVYLGLPGAYFDGSFTPTAGETYIWDGTANASTSTATEVAGTPTLKMEWTPQDWLVV